MTDIAYSRFIDPPLTPATRRYWGRRLPNSLQRKWSASEKAPPPVTTPQGMAPPPYVPIVWGRAFDPASSRISVADIARICARHAMISVAELKSPRRARYVCRARQVAMYIATKHTNRSLPEIGRLLGGKDHTTVMHARDKVTKDLDEGGEIFGLLVTEVERELGVA